MDKLTFNMGAGVPSNSIPGRLSFSIDGTTGSIYLDRDTVNNRVKFNADAKKLDHTVKINNTDFDGSKDITTEKWGVQRDLKIGDTAISVDGSDTLGYEWTHNMIGASLSSSWTGGKTAGPQLNLTVNGKTHTTDAIPSAGSSASGIVTTEAQTFSGVKTFNGGIHDESNASIYSKHFYHREYDVNRNVYQHFYDAGKSDSSVSSKANLRVWDGPNRTFRVLYFDGDGNLSWNWQNIPYIPSGSTSVGSASKPVYISGNKFYSITDLNLGDKTNNTWRQISVSRKNSSDASSGTVTWGVNANGAFAEILFENFNTAGTSTGVGMLGLSTTALYPQQGLTFLGTAAKPWNSIYFGNYIFTTYNNATKTILQNHQNGNITLSAAGNGLFLGYYDTVSLIFGNSSGQWGNWTADLLNVKNNLYVEGTGRFQTSTNSYALNTASFICDSWVRTTGNTGWRSETYGGGWYMSDDTWIRAYNNKPVYVSNTSTAALYTSGGVKALKGFTNEENGVTTTINSYNSSWTHYQTNSPSGHWFNKSVSVAGNIYAGSSYSDLVLTTANYSGYLDSRYLRLAGGTMNGTAIIRWADSGNWNNSNSGVTFPVVRGGLEWYGQSDWIKIFAEETANDLLNLVCQFGDDANPALVFRNKDGTQVAKIGADGIISATTFSGSLSGNASSATYLGTDTSFVLTRNSLQYFNISGTAGNALKTNDTPTTAWWHIMRCTHANSAGYYTDLAIPFNDVSLYYKRISNGSVQNGGWIKVLDSNNYTSYTVKKDGTGASGTWGISISGKADYVTDLSSTANQIGFRYATITSPGYFAAWNGRTIYAISNTVARTFMSAMSATLSGSYYGMGQPDGDVTNWIRTTSSGIIPYTSGGSSALGTESWPFNSIWSKAMNIINSYYPCIYLTCSVANGASTYTRAYIEGNYGDQVNLWVDSNKTTTANSRRAISLQGFAATSNVANALSLRQCDTAGTWLSDLLIYHQGNMVYSSSEPTNPVTGMLWLQPI